MKKAIIAGLLAICWIAVSQQQASAWINSRFGIGLNWDFSSGGNSVGWGLFRGNQPPGPEVFGGGRGGQGGYGGGFDGGYGGMPQGGFMYGGASAPAPVVAPAVAPVAVPGTQVFPPAPQGIPHSMMDSTSYAAPYAVAPMYYSGPYQFANNPRPIYYYPNTWYGSR